MKLPVYDIVFYFFSAALVLSALTVVLSRNPVQSILFLILCFFASAALWIMLHAEFLALVLLFVYVGAVMTLFMFVLMMTQFQGIFSQPGGRKFLPFALLVFVLFLGIICLALISSHLPMMQTMPHAFAPDYNNTRALGTLLFTDYVYPFEIAGAILLVSIIAAITLAFHGKRHDAKRQNISAQQAANKQERLKVIKMKGESS